MVRPEDFDVSAAGPRRGARRVRFSWSLAAALLTACSQSPADKAREAAAELHSWDATLRLLDRAAAAEAVPRRFAVDARRVFEQERERAQAKVRQGGGR